MRKNGSTESTDLIFCYVQRAERPRFRQAAEKNVVSLFKKNSFCQYRSSLINRLGARIVHDEHAIIRWDSWCISIAAISSFRSVQWVFSDVCDFSFWFKKLVIYLVVEIPIWINVLDLQYIILIFLCVIIQYILANNIYFKKCTM